MARTQQRTQVGAPGGIRTLDPWLRKPVLYPLSHWGMESLVGVEPTCTGLQSATWPLGHSDRTGFSLNPTAREGGTSTGHSVESRGIEPRCSCGRTRRDTAMPLSRGRFTTSRVSARPSVSRPQSGCVGCCVGVFCCQAQPAPLVPSGRAIVQAITRTQERTGW